MIYYDTDASGQPIKLTSTSIFAAIEGIEKGTVKPKSSESFAEQASRVGPFTVHVLWTIIDITSDLQYLNEKIIGLETFMFNKPLQFIGIIIVVIAAIFLGLRRAVVDEVDEIRNGKDRRLD